MKTVFGVATACWMGVVCTGTAAVAGAMGDGLPAPPGMPAPEEEIAIFIELAEKADLGQLRGLPRAYRRRALPNVLRSHAEKSQAPLIEILKAQGAHDLRTVWVSNLLAARVPAKVAESLRERPEVASIRLQGSAGVLRREQSLDGRDDPERPRSAMREEAR